jgi:hypothetical protein
MIGFHPVGTRAECTKLVVAGFIEETKCGMAVETVPPWKSNELVQVYKRWMIGRRGLVQRAGGAPITPKKIDVEDTNTR